MSGLFRYNANVTPSRRTTLGSFCVSNQDVSNLDGSFGFGYRSTGGAMPNNATGALSPTQGRSLREYDEKFQALRKENFNLKLRVYFLEEKLPTTGTAAETKQNIDLKVEIEGLRKELLEKQDLLMQASKAMTLLEESAKELREKHASDVDELSKRIEDLQDEMQCMHKRSSVDETAEYNGDSKESSRNSSQYDDPQTMLARYEHELQQLSGSNKSLAEALADRNALIDALEQQLANVHGRSLSGDQSAELEQSSTEHNEADGLEPDVLVFKQRLADKQCQIQDLEEKLAEKTSAHDKGLQTLQLLLIKTKEMDAEIERLKSRNSSMNASSSTTDEDLRLELEHARSVAEQERYWRSECAEVCSVLTIRLKELAGFLDSLLKHKDVLGVLAQDSHRAMRKAVDNSLDLSRNLSMTSQGRFSLNEKSLMQMSSITEVLNDSYFAGRDLLANESMAGSASTIDKMRDEIHALRSELERVRSEAKTNVDGSGMSVQRDRSLRNVSMARVLNSDSEEQWSEPDRKVSHERIGLDSSAVNASVRSPGNGKYKVSASSSASDELEFHLSRKNTSLRLQEKVNDLETQLASKSKEVADVLRTLLATDADNAALKQNVDRLTKELDTSEQLRIATDMALHDTKKQLVLEHSRAAEQLGASERLLEEQKTVNIGLAKELDKLTEEIGALAEAHVLEMSDMLERESQKLVAAKREMAEQYRDELAERIDAHNEKMMREMVPRAVYEEQVLSGEDLEKRLHEVESLLEIVRNREHELHADIDEKERSLRDLKRTLDEVTLQQSRAVLERTKFMNERDQFERFVQELKEKNDELASASSELHSNLAKLSHDNAQLHNKLVVNETQFQLTRSASQGNARYAFTSFKDGPASLSGPTSGGDQSGYTSDETRQRLENSSPDLGIESDGTGRSSGTDMNTVRSPTGKLSRSITDIVLESAEELDEDYTAKLDTSPKAATKSPTGPPVHHDCEKIDRENAELRRKLDRTRRAFERTWAQLRVSNQRKEQIEKDIRQEIYKTHSVLKHARTNIETADAPSPLKSTTPNK